MTRASYCMGTTHGGKYPCNAKAKLGGYCLQHHPDRAAARAYAKHPRRAFFTALTDAGIGLDPAAAVRVYGVLVAMDAVTVIDVSEAVGGGEPRPTRFSTATHPTLYYPGTRAQLLELLRSSMEIVT